ncbi:VOC family protein [Paenibacillus mendelii]|uniref:VOC family protein n=1 Tax=Paenibacillus mendelii TaxID=206163 RepID=A0ABV6J6B7_9BACL|nr:VOC family protein [Paenibacillus mendelii]MCQ6560259.1 VOC family protein [Paenibacillus mendelii]
MAVDVYLNFNGNCRDAVEFYAQVFDTEATHMTTFGEAPPNPDYQLPEEVKHLIMHTRLNILGSNVMFSDVFPEMPFIEGNNISLAIVHNDLEDIKKLFHKLQEGGKVVMELQETFWSKGYGSLEDKFGIQWQFNYDDGEQFM